MAFGIFNKKQPSKPEKTPVKGKAPVKKADAPKAAAPTPVVEEEGFSLDFTDYASPEEVEQILSPLTGETKSILNPAGLDFGALAGEAPAVPEAAPAPAPAPAPAAEAKKPSLADSMGMDFSSFVQKAEAMVETPVAKAPPPPAPAAKAPSPPTPAAPVAKAPPPPAPAAPVAPIAKAPPPPAPAAPVAKAPPAPAPAAAKPPPPAPAAKAPAPPPSAPASDTDDTVDFAAPVTLDFIPKPAVPPAKAEAAAPAQKATATDRTVDFTPLNFDTQTPKLQPRPVMAPKAVEAPPESTAEAPPPAPPAKAPAAKAPPPPPPKAVPPPARGPKSVAKAAKGPKSKASIAPVLDDSAPNSVLIVEVESGKKDVPAPIEESAMLFANGQASEAVQKLDQAIAGGKLKGWNLPAWLMRFDAYQQLGRKNEFEEKALDFIVKFERSPPAWVDAPADDGASRPGSSANINLSGPLSAASANAFAQIRKAAEKQPKLRIDFAKLESLDKEGAKLLFDTLKSLRAAKKEVYISGEGQILNLLRSKAVTGDTHNDQSFWLLLLDLYQSLGMLAEFEEAAVDYAVTYEVSPPSWEARPKVQPPVAKPEASGVRVSSDDSFRLQGEIAGQQDPLFKLLTDYAAKASPVMIDFAHVHRIDFVNAGRLAGIVGKVAQAGRAVVLRGAGEMTIALFAVVGLHQHARIIPRK